jgi:signal transduction histidine kinase
LWERIGRMENLINGLLHYARIGRMAAILERVSVEELLLEIKELVVPSHFQFIVQSPMPVLMTEKIHLDQVFTNLISNAVKYQSRQTGTIRVDCTEEEHFYRFSVQDDGIGIAEAYHQKIFHIFQTLREKNEEESTGIGLAIVKKILEEQGGTVSVTSQPGKGSTFIFTWPKNPVIPTVNEG